MNANMVTLIVERCAQTLENAVAPKLTDTFAAAQLSAVYQLLRLLAPGLEAQGAALEAENTMIRKVLANVMELLTSDPELSDSDLQHKMADAIVKRLSDAQPPAGILAANQALKVALADTIDGLEGLAVVLPAVTIGLLRNELRAALRLQLNHEIGHLSLPV